MRTLYARTILGVALIAGLVFFAVFAPLPPHAVLTHASIR
jgi:hypothetical protein